MVSHFSLPADVLWDSFVTYSFPPADPFLHFSPLGRNEYVTNEPQRTSAGRLLALNRGLEQLGNSLLVC